MLRNIWQIVSLQYIFSINTYMNSLRNNGEEMTNKPSIGKTRISLKTESFFRLIGNERNQSVVKLRCAFIDYFFYFLSLVLFRGKKNGTTSSEDTL